MKVRLDVAVVKSRLVATRSQAENFIKLGQVKVNGKIVTKPGLLVAESDRVDLIEAERYVSRAGLKLASVAKELSLDFRTKIVLDVGSSTGGFTDYALKNGAKKVIAVDIGTNQLHPNLRDNPKIELHEQTDIRDFAKTIVGRLRIDIVVMDVSFVSLREILPSVAELIDQDTVIVAMVKPQFEIGARESKHKGIIKNEKMRRQILKDFELWAQAKFVIIAKADSGISGDKGNLERFYKLKKLH